MSDAYKIRIIRNGHINGQDVRDDMEIRMQWSVNPMSNQAGRDEIARRFAMQYGIDIVKLGLYLSNIKVEKVR